MHRAKQGRSSQSSATLMPRYVQVAVKIILGFDEVWLDEKKLRVFRAAFKEWTDALFCFLPTWTRFIPSTSEPLPRHCSCHMSS